MAQGAGLRGVLRLVLGQGMTLVLACVGIGLASALAFTRPTASMLFGVNTIYFADSMVALTMNRFQVQGVSHQD
jgi:hypothetical protein